MSNLTAAQVDKALRDGSAEFKHWRTQEWEVGASVEGDGWTEIGGWRLNIDGEQYEISIVDETGGMDEGSNASVTIKVGDQYFRKNGYYASHYGYDWDGDFEEVEPVEKLVTVYESK